MEIFVVIYDVGNKFMAQFMVSKFNLRASSITWHNLRLFRPRLFCESRINLRLILEYVVS